MDERQTVMRAHAIQIITVQQLIELFLRQGQGVISEPVWPIETLFFRSFLEQQAGVDKPDQQFEFDPPFVGKQIQQTARRITCAWRLGRRVKMAIDKNLLGCPAICVHDAATLDLERMVSITSEPTSSVITEPV